MAITKKIQFLRNNTIYTGADGAAARNAAIVGMRGIATGSTTSGDIVDGQAILARYNAAGSASTGDVQTIYGIVHKGVNGKTGVTIYESSELLWAAINAMSDTAMTQSSMTDSTTGNYPILLKMDTTSDPVTSGAYFANSVTINKDGELSATSVKATSISGGSVTASGNIRGGNVSAATITATTDMRAGNMSAGTITANTGIRAGNVSAATISAATSIYSPSVSGATISGGSVTASGNIRGGNVSADTISAATHVKAPTISATSAYGATISGGTYLNLPAATSAANGVVKVVETTGTTSGNTVMSQKAVTDAITGMISVADALVYKGTVSGQSTSPGASLPKADKGDVYKVAAPGYVAGQKVEVGDMFICNTDNTASGTASTNWDVIQTNIDMANYVQTARTVTGSTGLSGGGNLGSDVVIRHDTITTTYSSVTASTLSHGGSFSAITSVGTDGMGHASGVTTTKFTLPDAPDTATTQSGYTDTTARPILLKSNTTTSAVTGGVAFVTAATIDGSGNFFAKTSVSSPSISATSITATNLVTASGFSATAAVSTASTDISASILLSNGKNTDTIDCGTY